ncbi:hypothetical protein THERMOS_646 [Bathymodiolus thermophilus thioautotrophic gill symbiont]|uniref:Uncharacterized protein n=1 Tax=Bathymodiolus thermophilus thioautotrophic gill symbiont TaxID=2360 RepID=A0A8H8XCF5_9GAMM|nr:hypothetical protein THERMOS_205 [Bathymodiolus thermophilus thioautotrophic gill symbiont]CAB5497271.1 hypothetical protein THERMOS_646 [Bathymodiolus thermophilus thioautotrophic gill symbiont]
MLPLFFIGLFFRLLFPTIPFLSANLYKINQCINVYINV